MYVLFVISKQIRLLRELNLKKCIFPVHVSNFNRITRWGSSVEKKMQKNKFSTKTATEDADSLLITTAIDLQRNDNV